MRSLLLGTTLENKFINIKRIITASLFIISAAAHAEQVDQDGVLKDDHGGVLTTIETPAPMESAERDGVLRDDQGKVILMYYTDAREACRKLGKDLPTIRKLAEVYQSVGITISNKEQRHGTDFEEQRSSTADGQRDKFFYSNAGYRPTTGDLGKYYFWSRSSGLYNYDPEFILAFYGPTGLIVYGFASSNKNAVLCISGQ